MIVSELLFKTVTNRLAYWREKLANAKPGSEVEKLCRCMIGLHETRIKQMEAELDGAGR